MYNSVFNGTTTLTSNNTTYNVTVSWPNIAPGLGYDYTYTTNTTTTGTLAFPNYKKCRNCHHAHLVGNPGCIEITGFSNLVYFSTCQCPEYVPSDNLEYLEYLDKKKSG